MSAESSTDLVRWLNTATRGLPSKVRAGVSAEIEAHYADAFEDYLSQGKSAVEAHRLALADLGEARLTAGALRETHFGRRRYVLAGFSSLAFNAFVLFAGTMVSAVAVNYMVTLGLIDLIFLMPALYALASLDVLLRRRYFYFEATRALTLARLGVVLVFATPLIPLAVFEPTVPPSVLLTLLADLVRISILSGGIMTGVGMILLGDSLNQLHDRLFQLRPLLCFGSFLCGFGILISTTAVALNLSADARSMALTVTVVGYPIFSSLLAVLFFRAAIGRLRRPAQMA